MKAREEPDPWEIDGVNIAKSLGNLLAVYVVGLSILFIYIALLGIGIRILLKMRIPWRESLMALYGVMLTAIWLYSWWIAIKRLRKIFISRQNQ